MSDPIAPSAGPFTLGVGQPMAPLSGGYYAVRDAGGEILALLPFALSGPRAEQLAANARLFMASPGLLQAAKALIAACPRPDGDDYEAEPEWQALEAAVALAEAAT